MNERNKVILLIGLILSALSGVYLYQGYKHYTDLVDQIVQVTETTFNSAINSVQEFSFAPYSNRIDNLLLNAPDIVTAFSERDRKLLYQKTLPRYKALTSENPFFQVMHFHLPDGTTLLRMNKPDFFGDNLNSIRPIIKSVHQNKKALYGYEIGRKGPFYRIVHPVFDNDVYIGALEFGIRIQALIDVIEKKIDAPVTSFFKEILLQKATHFPHNKFIQYGDYCLLTRDRDIYSQLPDTLELGKNDRQVMIGGQTFIVHSHLMFKNFQDMFIGGITVLQDITPLLKQRQKYIKKSAALILLLSGIAFTVLYLGFGKITGSLLNEITDRKKAQAAANKAKQEWERTVDAVPDLISILDKYFRIIRCNKAVPEMLGLSMDDVLGIPCHKLFCGKDNAPEECPYRILKQNKQPCSNEIYYKKLGYVLDVNLSPLYDENGDFVGAVHVARNISKRKKLEQQLRANHLYLQSILEASTNTAIVATDAKMRIKYCNAETERLLGYPVDTILNRSIMEVHAKNGIDTSNRFEKAVTQVRQHGVYQFLLQRDDYILDAQISSMNDEDGNFSGMLLIGKDVTAQKKAENKLLKAEKFEAIGLMAGGVAHDLNNILSGIISYPELLRRQLPADSDLQRTLFQIQKAGQRAADVVADLLTMARGVARVKELISLNDLIREYLTSPEFDKLKVLHPKISITCQLGKNCWNCKCSPTHIIKTVMNLVTNAVEAITNSGTVSITTYNQESSPQQTGDLLQSHDFLVIEIRDTGPGIAEEHLEHIFEPFYSTKEMGRSGSGLGLSVVWNTIQEHGGVTTVSSDKNGTVFTLYLPADRTSSIKKESNESIDNLKRLNGKGTVLIVDDDENQRKIAQQILTIFGYTSHAVSSGEEAVSWFHKNSADLLLLDMVMGPGLNGRETYEKIIRFHPNQKALIISGLAQDSEMEKAIQLGVKGFVSKPYSLEEFGRAIQQVMKS